jgi:hypothetical protein
LADESLVQGLSPRPLSAYGCGGIDGFEGLVMGYANVPAEDMSRHVRHLLDPQQGLGIFLKSEALFASKSCALRCKAATTACLLCQEVLGVFNNTLS